MKKTEKRIVAFCIILSAIIFLAAVSVFSFHLISTTVAARSDLFTSGKKSAVSANEEPATLSEEEQRLQDIFDEIDSLRKKQRKAHTGKVGSFDELTNEEKNRIWWKIVSIAQKVGDDPVQYKLTVPQAMRISDRYGPSELEVYLFLREGSQATWRTERSPEDAEKKS